MYEKLLFLLKMVVREQRGGLVVGELRHGPIRKVRRLLVFLEGLLKRKLGGGEMGLDS